MDVWANLTRLEHNGTGRSEQYALLRALDIRANIKLAHNFYASHTVDAFQLFSFPPSLALRGLHQFMASFICANVYKSKDSLRRHMHKHKQSNLQVESDAIDSTPATDEKMPQESNEVPTEDKKVYLGALSLQPHQPKSLIKVESPSSM